MGSQSKVNPTSDAVSEVLNQHREHGSTGTLELETVYGVCVFELQAGRVVRVNADESSENTDVEKLFAAPCLSTRFEPTSAAQPAKRTLLFTTGSASTHAEEGPSVRTVRIAPSDLDDVRKRVAEAKLNGTPHKADLPKVHTPANTAKAALGRYEVVSRIGTGGLGSVFLCTARGAHDFERHVAVKVLRTDLSHDRRALKALSHEAKLASLAAHPNLIRALDFGEHNQQPYLVMDYVEGITLAQIARHGAMPSAVAAKILVDALAGLAAFHRLCTADGQPLHAIHCDISPQNLLVGTDGVTRLIDYSSARSRIMQSEIQRTEGRAAYLAPERLLGKDFDQRSDLFSLGTVFYECLTGHRLFAAETPEATLNNVLSKSPVPPSHFGPNCPVSFDALCLRALSRDPALRFVTAEEMLDFAHQMAMREGRLASNQEVARFMEAHFSVEIALLRAGLPHSSLAANSAASAASETVARTGEFSALRDADDIALPADDGTERVQRHLAAMPSKQRALWVAGAIFVLIVAGLTLFRPTALSFLFQVEGLDDPESGEVEAAARPNPIRIQPISETASKGQP